MVIGEAMTTSAPYSSSRPTFGVCSIRDLPRAKAHLNISAKIPTAKKPPKLLRKRPLLIPPNIASQSLLDSRYWEAAQSVHFDYSQR